MGFSQVPLYHSHFAFSVYLSVQWFGTSVLNPDMMPPAEAVPPFPMAEETAQNEQRKNRQGYL